MAAFIDDHVDQIIVEDFHIDNMDHHPHEDTDVPLLSDVRSFRSYRLCCAVVSPITASFTLN